MNSSRSRLRGADFRLLPIGLLAIIFLALLARSLDWVMAHDSPLFYYEAFLMDQHSLVPYRDFFEINAPGTMLSYYFFYKVFGVSRVGFRLADLSLLGSVLLLAYFTLRQITDRAAALAGTLLFGAAYSLFGAWALMQREVIALLPMAAAIYLAVRRPRRLFGLRNFFLGSLCAAMMTIKPHLAIIAPALLGAVLFQGRTEGESKPHSPAGTGSIFFFFLAGFAAGVGLCAGYLVMSGAAGPFVHMAVNFWPLYPKLGGKGEILARAQSWAPYFRLFEVITGFRFYGLLVFGYLAGMGLIRGKSEKSVPAALLLVLNLLLAAYVVIGKKMFSYHTIPVYYVMSLISGLAFGRDPGRESGPQPPGSARQFLFAAIIIMSLPYVKLGAPSKFSHLYDRIFPGPPPPAVAGPRLPPGGDVQRIAEYLRHNLRPGDRVVPLDGVKGAVHAMLLAQARLSGSFLYDFQFYYQCDHPYIIELRTRFIGELERERPKFIIRFQNAWRPHGALACDFPELETILAQSYQADIDTKNYQVLRLKE